MVEKAVVLLSGGLDSATCLAVAVAEGREVYPLSFDYGQRHRFELSLAAKQAAAAGAPRHEVVRFDLRSFGGSALTSDEPVPKDGSSQGIPATYVPARNAIFLAFGLAYAEAIGATEVFIGVNALDYSGYPDCRPEFIRAFQAVADVGTKAGAEGRAPRIRAPLIDMSKAEIIRLGMGLGVDFALTSSCYDPDESGRPCGRCEACRLREKGFAEAGLDDPAARLTNT